MRNIIINYVATMLVIITWCILAMKIDKAEEKKRQAGFKHQTKK